MVKDLLGKNLNLIKNKKLFLFDMDGTINIGNILFDGVKNLLKKITDCGGDFVFISNNSSKSVKDYIEKLKRLSIKCTEKNFFISSQASAILIKKEFKDSLIYVQATKSCLKELKKYKVNFTTKYNENVKAILVGFDLELTSKKMETTCKLLTKLNVPFYATNPDWVCPVEFGYVPDCGSMCFGYEKATGKKPIYIGKPNPYLINLVMEKFNVKNKDTIVIGDRIYTDIKSGINAKVDTLLVLSGESTMQDYLDSEDKPTYLLNNIVDLSTIFGE